MPSRAEHKDVYRRIIAAISTGDFAALDALMSSDIVDHNPGPDQDPGLVGFKQWMAAARTSFPDLCGTPRQVLGEGDLVAARVTWRGTHLGVFAGHAPTGRLVEFDAYHIVRFDGGRASEWWGVAETSGAATRR
jgi:predicted ester cyclase